MRAPRPAEEARKNRQRMDKALVENTENQIDDEHRQRKENHKLLIEDWNPEPCLGSSC